MDMEFRNLSVLVIHRPSTVTQQEIINFGLLVSTNTQTTSESGISMLKMENGFVLMSSTLVVMNSNVLGTHLKET
jgi:hypothetical protein